MRNNNFSFDTLDLPSFPQQNYDYMRTFQKLILKIVNEKYELVYDIQIQVAFFIVQITKSHYKNNMNKHFLVLKNQQLKPDTLTLSLGAIQCGANMEVLLKIGKNGSGMQSNVVGGRKYIFFCEETDQETPPMTQDDQYCFNSFSQPGTYHISCLTFPKIRSVIHVKEDPNQERKSATVINLKGIKGLESVEQEREDSVKEENNVKEDNTQNQKQEFDWFRNEELGKGESPFGTPNKADFTDYNRALLREDDDQTNTDNKYLRYFQEEFKLWRNFFDPEQPPKQHRSSTPDRQKPKSERRKNSNNDELDEDWSKFENYSPDCNLTFSSRSPSNYENFSLNEKKEKSVGGTFLYSHQEVNDRQEEEIQQTRTMKKTNSQYRLQIEHKQSTEKNSEDGQPPYKNTQKKKTCPSTSTSPNTKTNPTTSKDKKEKSLMKFVEMWSKSLPQIKIQKKTDKVPLSQWKDYIKNKYQLSRFLYS